MKKLLHRIFSISFYLVLVLLILYYYFYYVKGEYHYYGYGSGMAFISAFLLTQQMYLKYFVGLVMVVMSGKRTDLVAILSVLLFYLVKRGRLLLMQRKLVTPRRILLVLLVLFFCWYSFSYIKNQGYLWRWTSMLKYDFLDFNDDNKMNLVTAGRWEEGKNIINVFKKEPIKWILGAGMGGEYMTPRTIGKEDYEPLHYAHFSPMSYLFLYGLPFTILLYLNFFVVLWKGLKFGDNFFYLSFIVFFITSFTGSILFVDPRPWFFLGVLKFMVKNKKKSPYILANRI